MEFLPSDEPLKKLSGKKLNPKRKKKHSTNFNSYMKK